MVTEFERKRVGKGGTGRREGDRDKTDRQTGDEEKERWGGVA